MARKLAITGALAVRTQGAVRRLPLEMPPARNCNKEPKMNPLTLFKSLADETRLRCMMLIRHQGELCVCELMAALSENQPKISRHLAQLRRAGLLQDRRQGQWVFYRINPALPPWADSVLAQTIEANADYMAADLNNLCRMGERPERLRACC